ncbi:unnamed protein product [Phytophthora fragariaefolia]|uniref:Unnamed protein product n=1 Tax=Phytophthora fragariaefolia TaxID=1490495 RepID=A0A9W7D2I9_9STRA|nr:unnamed protein product [Phytophthora fragariaefolia]
MAQPGYIEEDDDFGVERDVFRVVGKWLPASKVRRISKPKAQVELTESLSPFEFVAVWALLLALHGLCGSYLIAVAMLYFFMENPLMAYNANLLALPEHRYFRLFGALVGILGGLHGLQLILHLIWSVKAHTPTVFPRAAMVSRVDAFIRRQKKMKVQPTASRSSRPSRSSWSRDSISAISSFTAAGLRDAFSVEGSNFALVFITRKFVEAVSQIVQCHRYSTLIGRVWINQVYVGIVVANYWATPLLDHLMFAASKCQVKRVSTCRISQEYVPKSIRERTLSVTVDTLLTMMSCMILPLIIFVPYAKEFDDSWYGFPTEILYGDVSFPNLIRENQALFALNFLDGITKLIPHLSIVLATASISLILELHSPTRLRRKSNSNISILSSTAVRGGSRISKSIKNTLKAIQPTPVVGLSFVRRVVVPCTFVAAGFLVLGLHIHAAFIASTADDATMKMCLQGLRPWFAVNVSCSVLEYNCYKHMAYPLRRVGHLTICRMTP